MVSLRLPGTGAYGWPLTHDPALVFRDVRDGKMSLEAARREYGVIIDPATWMVDEAAAE